jgi:hypothetical protein
MAGQAALDESSHGWYDGQREAFATHAGVPYV